MTFNTELVDVTIAGKYFEAIDVTVEFEYTESTRGDRDDYGAPLEPDTPEEIEILSIVVDIDGNGQDVKDEIDDLDYIETLAWEEISDLELKYVS